MQYSTDTCDNGRAYVTADTAFTATAAPWPGYNRYFLPPPPGAGSVHHPNHWLLQRCYQYQPSAAPYGSQTYYLPIPTTYVTALPAPQQTSTSPTECFFRGSVPLGPAAPPLPPPGGRPPAYVPCWTQPLQVTEIPAHTTVTPAPLPGRGVGIPLAHLQQMPPHDVTSQVGTSQDVLTSSDTSRQTPSPDSGYSSCESPTPLDTTTSPLDAFLASLGPRPPDYKKRLGGKPRAPKCCHLCPKTYTRSKSLTAHLVACHPSALRSEELAARRAAVTCGVCSKVFTSSCSMRTHMRSHTGERPFRCDICEKVFSDRAVWRRHRQNHSGAKDFVCVVCGFEFSQSANLKRHLALKHPDTVRKDCE